MLICPPWSCHSNHGSVLRDWKEQERWEEGRGGDAWVSFLILGRVLLSLTGASSLTFRPDPGALLQSLTLLRKETNV